MEAAFQILLASHSLPYCVHRRLEIVETATRHHIKETARICGCSRNTVKRWIRRIADFIKKLDSRQHSVDFIVESLKEVFSDQERSGRKDTFSAVEVCRIIKVALEKPEDLGYPISHWSRRELTIEVIKRGIVDSISERSIGRILSDVDLKPHKSRYWLNPSCKDEDFDRRVEEVCKIYQNAQALDTLDVKVVSIDEKTGIQALERIAPDKVALPGRPAQMEAEYRRHGTLCLIPSFDVATGQIIQYSIGDTRNELDFLEQIHLTIDTAPEANWIFIADQLNIHKSESLVRFVAETEGIPQESLGVKGKKGILKNLQSRMAFLENTSHRIRFFYTPKHCSWLNQVEIWFGIISRKLLRKSSFTSKEHLKGRIVDFIKYFNEHMSKPFKWTYQGKALKS